MVLQWKFQVFAVFIKKNATNRIIMKLGVFLRKFGVILLLTSVHNVFWGFEPVLFNRNAQ